MLQENYSAQNVGGVREWSTQDSDDSSVIPEQSQGFKDDPRGLGMFKTSPSKDFLLSVATWPWRFLYSQVTKDCLVQGKKGCV